MSSRNDETPALIPACVGWAKPTPGGVMVQVRVLGVALDPAQQHVILLKPVDDLSDRVLPVWIGSQEATSILVAVEGVAPPRPLAHDLMVRLLDATDATVDRVEVTRIDDGTFYAEITVTALTGSRVIDARPSDAIALASRAGAPIFVADDVLAEAGIPDTVSEAPEGAETPEAAEQRVAEFREFLDDIDPDDFRG
ncbi:hypothetical protein GCM10017586_28080 [Microbacterium imperiale]|uniref:BFN domain-containing protein n=2 Tax=Microbacterium imperiale TaxID=33884 RepID=A0A9W6HIH0_9MICO|nr:bifunctional nuclease family protein [Microbacterium imperiale]GLJ81125.1 hypothetical protein GCM10017586_28080 [Microbacterium imperiale]